MSRGTHISQTRQNRSADTVAPYRTSLTLANAMRPAPATPRRRPYAATALPGKARLAQMDANARFYPQTTTKVPIWGKIYPTQKMLIRAFARSR